MNQWPQGMTLRPIVTWPGVMTKRRVVSNFSALLRNTLTLMHTELRQIKARDVVMQIALEERQFRQDGYPRAGADPEHPGIILSMNTPDGALSFPCDSFVHWEDNLRAIVLTMEKLRAIKRYGVATNGEQYAGWKALDAPRPEPAAFSTRDEAEHYLYQASKLGDPRIQPLGVVIRAAKRNAHPDTGGSTDLFRRVIAAEQFLKEN